MTSTAGQRRSPLRALLVVPLLVICGLAAAFGFLPTDDEAPYPPPDPGGDDRGIQDPRFQTAWPALPPVDPEQAALGRLLFYDPVLSGNNDLACASCHHPDLGFADGLALSRGAGDQPLRRSAPSLWNVAFVRQLFWDGRADSLEAQLIEPLTSPQEMGADLDALLDELLAIPEYERRFDSAFSDGITVENIARAIAAFERTLLSNDSPVDRYVAGDFNALTPPQRRGFDLFRGARTRCLECHTWPLLTDDTFHVLGVPDTNCDQPDRGRQDVADEPGARYAFRTPTLRNVALTAPYMHNGAFDTLEEVIDFYASGGGARGIDVRLDEKLTGFRLTPQQTADLVAFLRALTSEPAALIEIPESVPSGLPVVARRDNPARAMAESGAALSAEALAQRQPQTLVVIPGGSIQAAVDRAVSGDTILVQPGRYYETIVVDTAGLTIRGDVRGDERPWLDGYTFRGHALNVTADDFTIEGMGIRDYGGYGIGISGAERVTVRDVVIERAGVCGLCALRVADFHVEHVRASFMNGAGIDIALSPGPVVIRASELYVNTIGVQIENSANIDLNDNHVHDNTTGILVALAPGEAPQGGRHARIAGNRVERNNRPASTPENAATPTVAFGVGILLVGIDDSEVSGNTIQDNATTGIALTSSHRLGGLSPLESPIPERNWIHDNRYANNGFAPQGPLATLGLPGRDLAWTIEGWSNAFDEPAASRFPALLPSRQWPDPLRRALWRAYDLLIRFRSAEAR